jgi:hypothetical protein
LWIALVTHSEEQQIAVSQREEFARARTWYEASPCSSPLLLVERSLVGIGRDTRVEDVSPEEMGKRVEKFMQDGGAG